MSDHSKNEPSEETPETDKLAYEPPMITRIDLRALSSQPLDSGMPLLAEEGSSVATVVVFPPSPTPPP